MSGDEEDRAGGPRPDTGPLIRALNQSEHVQDTVEQAAADLSSVNAVLKDEIDAGAPLAQVERALDQSEVIESQIQEAAEELVAVNDALAEEVDVRLELERRLSKSDAALSESRAEERKSRHSALHDGVTGLANFTLFKDRLCNALPQAERHQRRLAVMFIDLDDFKGINDAHGHDTGDRVLEMVGKRLQGIVRGGDTVSRRSGDEFLVLMLEANDRFERRRPRRSDRRRPRGAVRHRWRDVRGEVQHRDRGLSGERALSAGTAQERRPGDVCGQATEEGRGPSRPD